MGLCLGLFLGLFVGLHSYFFLNHVRVWVRHHITAAFAHIAPLVCLSNESFTVAYVITERVFCSTRRNFCCHSVVPACISLIPICLSLLSCYISFQCIFRSFQHALPCCVCFFLRPWVGGKKHSARPREQQRGQEQQPHLHRTPHQKHQRISNNTSTSNVH